MIGIGVYKRLCCCEPSLRTYPFGIRWRSAKVDDNLVHLLRLLRAANIHQLTSARSGSQLWDAQRDVVEEEPVYLRLIRAILCSQLLLSFAIVVPGF